MDEITLIAAETFCVSSRSGQVHAGGERGLFLRDTRALAHLVLRLDGREPYPLSGRAVSPSGARFTAWWRAPGDTEPDPKLLVERRRVLSASLWEQVRLINHGVAAVQVEVSLQAGADFGYIFDVKHQRAGVLVRGVAADGGLVFHQPDTDQETVLRSQPLPDQIDPADGVLRWWVELAPNEPWAVQISVGFRDRGQDELTWPSQVWQDQELPPGTRPAPSPTWQVPTLHCSDPRVTSLAAHSAADLASLLVTDPADPRDRFFAAGSPWFLTLFGRDSLWAAFMALPMDVALAGQTLRVLARRQGTRVDPETEEEPGKILHEVRHGGLVERSDLPPVYYGTMDATPLFVVLLHEAWRWGLPQEEVRDLLPAAERALAWMRDDGDGDGDGFLEYLCSGERGLANQGWKDSTDGIQFADGRLAEPPIALCEVQGYAYDAAMRGAELLDAFGRPGGEGWRAWAGALARRFREAFWIDHPDGAYPALALDGRKRQVDVVASNMGHLPASGMLDAEECALVARRLGSPDMDAGWGLRTMSSRAARFNPLSYHGGSVWPHDTALAVHGLARAGHTEQAVNLIRGLVAAAPHFTYRLPELFGGEQRTLAGVPMPYPAACRPQAWAAGASWLLVRSALGLNPDLPSRRIVVRPLWPFPWNQLDVRGMVLGGGRLSLVVTHEQGVYVREAPEGVEVVVEGAPQVAEGPGVIGPLVLDAAYGA